MLLACTSPQSPQPSLWTYHETATQPPPLADLPTIKTGIERSIYWLLRADPNLPYEAFSSYLAQMQDDCPSSEDHHAQLLNLGDCSDSVGNRFYGYQISTNVWDSNISYNGIDALHHNFRWMTGTARYEMADGRQFESMGDALLQDYITEDGFRGLYMYLWGDYRRINDPTDDWMTDGIGVEMVMEAHQSADGWQSLWNGGIIRIPDTFPAFSLKDFQINDTCPLEPQGTLKLWDPNQRWYDITYDTNCDGCAQVTQNGTELGSVCADYSPLTNWEEQPWAH